MDSETLEKSINKNTSEYQFYITIITKFGRKRFYSNNITDIDNCFDKLKRYCTLRKIEEDYYFLEILGSGATSIVWMVKSKKKTAFFAAKAFLEEEKTQFNQVLIKSFFILNRHIN